MRWKKKQFKNFAFKVSCRFFLDEREREREREWERESERERDEKKGKEKWLKERVLQNFGKKLWSKSLYIYYFYFFTFNLPPFMTIWPLCRVLDYTRRCSWCNSYRRRKSTRQHEFKSWTRLIAFHIALIPLGKLWIQLFSLHLRVNSRAD